MADVHSKESRSYNMSKIRNKDTKPELLVRKFLHSRGFRYRLRTKQLPGKPDIFLSKLKTIIFIHGCFWHSHEGCKFSSTPKSNLDYWEPKLNRNMMRDHINEIELNERGWNVLKVWECDLKKDKIEETLQKLLLLIDPSATGV